ncbi:MAG TPA: NADH-quinone oxidoreductase subunit L [Verrucomicrobiae bacterium]|jgi:NADH-quinone oxidoreductase subunit L|nr:NADH-quinone oxidoreductase subunit L [Verrucomicrobiae bacterium]
MEYITFLILFLPLAAAGIITLFTQKLPAASARISIAAIAFSFLLSLLVYGRLGNAPAMPVPGINWFSVGNLKVEIGFLVDHLSVLMLLVVTGVGLMIHIYSYGYMHGDPGFSRFFASLSLFTFSMLGIVFATNFFQMFVFWELVGVSSYLLIGYWFEKPSAADAGKKAFIANRIGDFGFLLGIISLWTLLGSVRFDELQQAITANKNALGIGASLVGFLIFMGAMGKSAQFPLHVWLPDAMEGPTPVSALIHAATMVAAGVYMLTRVFFIYSATPGWPHRLSFLDGVTALGIVAWIGGITSLLAALIAVQQNDIKRILAYSTLSQLGYMIMSVGLNGTTPAMYHLTTHAFFKALLFLGAGSVIHGMHHEQDIWKMGALRKKMPTTFWTFLFATLALAGVWPLSGFYSKDEILGNAVGHNPVLFGIAALVAVLTTFYMFRLVFVVFYAPEKSREAAHAHESPAVMTAPLLLLVIPAIGAGFFGIDYYINTGGGHEPAELHGFSSQLLAPFTHAPLGALFGLGAVIFGFSAAWGIYYRATGDPIPVYLPRVSRAMRNRFYFDEFYASFISLTHENLSKVAATVDRWIVGGVVVKGLQGTTDLFGRGLRLVQTGNLQTYAFLIVIGFAALLYFFLRP